MADEARRVPIRGGSWNNGAIAGLGALNLNNRRVNSSGNVGFRPLSPCKPDAKRSRAFDLALGKKES
ncbi:MAG: hypothetical protein LBK25_04920 [Treponema sp.]|nr:hypothetical protein [Treponema sp.]